MANYAVDDFTESASDMAALLALIETKLETYDDGKNIRLLEVYKDATNGGYSYALIIDA
jgi:hydrogenase maturation factor